MRLVYKELDEERVIKYVMDIHDRPISAIIERKKEILDLKDDERRRQDRQNPLEGKIIMGPAIESFIALSDGPLVVEHDVELTASDETVLF